MRDFLWKNLSETEEQIISVGCEDGTHFALSTGVFLRVSHKQRNRLSVLDVKMGHTLLSLPGFFLLNLLYRGQAQDAVLTFEPNWTAFFSGESVTFKCDITGGKDRDWFYSIYDQHREVFPPSKEKFRTLHFLSKGYKRPEPVLTVSPSWPSPGASVTLNCRVDHPSAGWSFYWHKAVPQKSDYSYSFELLPGNLNSAASLTVSPDSVQHFTKTSLSLSCEGNSTEWRVMRFSKSDYLYPCSSWGTMAGSTCKITRSWLSGVFWCESETGQFSNAVNITKDVLSVLWLRDLAALWTFTDYSPAAVPVFIQKVKRSQRTNQSPATDHMINQDETNQRENGSVLQDNACLYETVKGPEEPANDESMDVTYSVLELKNISKKGKKNEPEDCVYSDVQMASSAAGHVTFHSSGSQVLHQRMKLFILNSNQEQLLVKMQRNIISNNVFCKDKTNGNNIPKLNLCLLNLICSFALHSSDSILTITAQFDRGEEETDSTLATKMVGGCQSCFLTNISVLLLGCFLHVSDVEASNPQREIHKKVGDTVELSSGLSTEGVTKTDWKYEGIKIADKEGVLKNTKFDSRLEFNPDNFSLTLRGLTLKDSGEFRFVSVKETGQRPTVIITLYVHASRPRKASTFPVLLTVGLLCGVLLIILPLLFLYRYRKSKDAVFIRSQSTNQGPATDHMINQDEIQNMPEYSTLLYGDRCLYETIGGPVEAGNGASNEPEESLYINVAADQ
ncbi:hypothetical protein NQZ68_038813 [Dissostichus eleginoides]|nr:hypothetical protein NQZ68_038813 [Dissostichus eleginoides]